MSKASRTARTIVFSLALFAPSATTWAVDTVGDDYGSEQLDTKSGQHRFQLSGGYDYVGEAKFRDSLFKGEKFKFAEGEASGRMVMFYNPCLNEGLTCEVGYTNTYLGWNENPYFNQKYFNNVSVELGGWSYRLPRWFWQGGVAMNCDVDHYDFNYFTTWDILLWGRYAYNPRINIHAGFLMMTGMKVDWFIPIFGFDWQINKKWKLNAVFPMNLSVVYAPNCYVDFSLAGRFFSVRHRTKDEDLLPLAIFEYRTTCAEFAVNFHYNDRFLLNLHAGSTFGGKLKITNKNHSDGEHLKFDASPYAGGQLTFQF